MKRKPDGMKVSQFPVNACPLQQYVTLSKSQLAQSPLSATGTTSRDSCGHILIKQERTRAHTCERTCTHTHRHPRMHTCMSQRTRERERDGGGERGESGRGGMRGRDQCHMLMMKLHMRLNKVNLAEELSNFALLLLLLLLLQLILTLSFLRLLLMFLPPTSASYILLKTKGYVVYKDQINMIYGTCKSVQ